MSVPFWDSNESGYEEGKVTEAWDICTLGGQVLPGITEVTGSPGIKTDIQKANGRDGAAIVQRGYIPAQIEISVTIWTPAQWTIWQQDVMPKIWRRPGKLDFNDQKKKIGASDLEVAKTAAIQIAHPEAASIGVTAIMITSISSPRPTSGVAGARTIKIKAIEYVPPPPPSKNAIRKATGVKPAERLPAYRDKPTTKNWVELAPSQTDGKPTGPIRPAPQGGS